MLRHASTNTKVIAVTKIQDPKRRQVILRSGANDILLAPFQSEEFLWRIHRIKQGDLTQLELDGWQINPSTGEAHHPDRGMHVHLTPAELSIFSKLWKAQGSVVLRTELVDEIGTKASLGRSLNTLVLRLRKKLEKDAQVPQFILTVPKRGYRLRVPS
jgi:two-component system OmpR family response regulator